MIGARANAWRRKPKHASGRRVGDAFRTPVNLAARIGPSFGLEDQEDDRGTLISGSVATLLHAGVVGAMALTAALAPEVAEELLTPVTILKELPGSNDPAKAGPRALAARTPAPTPASARAVARVKPMDTERVSAKALTLDELQKAVAPRQLERAQAEAKRVEAKAIDTRVKAEAVNMAEFQPVTVSPSDLTAPTAQVQAPRQVAPGEVVDISAPQAFQQIEEAGAVEYSEHATSSADLASSTVGVSSQFAEVAIEFDGTGNDYVGGGGPGGGEGGTPGTVPCMESAYVDRYLEVVRRRTYARWIVPVGTPIGAKAVLRFELDAAGSATRVRSEPTENPDFGASAVQALRSASPFPPMDDAVRCLDGKRMRSIFTHVATED